MIGSILSQSMSARDSRRLTRKTLKSLCPSFHFTSRRSHSPLAISVDPRNQLQAIEHPLQRTDR